MRRLMTVPELLDVARTPRFRDWWRQQARQVAAIEKAYQDFMRPIGLIGKKQPKRQK